MCSLGRFKSLPRNYEQQTFENNLKHLSVCTDNGSFLCHSFACKNTSAVVNPNNITLMKFIEFQQSCIQSISTITA